VKDIESTRDRTTGGVLHTIVTCDIDRTGRTTPDQCTAKAMRGTWAGARYITRDDVYLWQNDRVVAFSLRDGSIAQHAARLGA